MTPARFGAAISAAIVAVAVITVPQLTAAPQFSEWSAPVNLGPLVNSAYDDGGAALSKNGLSLYFASNRPGGEGDLDIWVSRRESLDDPWQEPLNLGPIVNTTGVERDPALSRDGHSLFMASGRPGGFGAFDIWAAWRAHTRDDFAWHAPVNLGSTINTSGQEAGPEYLENDDAGVPLLFLTRPRSGAPDIFVSELQLDGSFGVPVPVEEINTPAGDAKAALRHDGLEMVFQSFRPGTIIGCAPVPCFDLWTATRETTSDPWSAPVSLGPIVNSAAIEEDAALTSDGEVLIFASTRSGGFGGFDLYMTTRTKLP